MALDPVPWFIGGGAAHSADVARLLVHVATGGAAGIVESTDLRVTQLPAPTGTIRIAAGAAIIPNTNAVQQSYALRAPSSTDLAITPTGSASGRQDLVVAYVDDPQFTGQVLPVDQVANGPYVKFAIIEGAGQTSKVPDTFAYPALALAGITLPANTATVTQAMISDFRRVAMPKRTRDLYNTQPSVTTSANSTTLVNFAPAAARQITIPEWATQAKVTCHIAGMVCRNGDAIGVLDVEFGSMNIQAIATDMMMNTRAAQIVSDTVAIPADVRGTTVNLRLMASRTSGTGTFQTDAWSTILWDIEFLEVASAD